MGKTYERYVYSLFFEYEDTRGAGCNFDCDSTGKVDVEALHPCSRDSYEQCLTGTVEGRKVIRRPVHTTTIRTCPCGSGKDRWEEFDARGISIGYVCGDCYEAKKAKYRPEIFTDSNYDTFDEVVEPEEY